MAKISAWPNASDYLRETIRTQVARIADLEHVRAEADEVHRKQVARIAALERENELLHTSLARTARLERENEALRARIRRWAESIDCDELGLDAADGVTVRDVVLKEMNEAALPKGEG